MDLFVGNGLVLKFNFAQMKWKAYDVIFVQNCSSVRVHNV